MDRPMMILTKLSNEKSERVIVV